MNIFIIGGGGREHAIALKVSESRKANRIYCAPGNAGIEEIAECADISVMDFERLIAFAKEKKMDLVIIGPDDPLAAGLTDAFEKEGFRVFGPDRKAALIESSKAFSKNLMKKYGIPTPDYRIFKDADEALNYVKGAKYPLVVKADGLALGKGVLICEDRKAAEEAVKEIMRDKKFGEAGKTAVIEEFITGTEVSVLCFCDGNTVKPMASAMDFKRAKDGDKGLNTGGMGNVSPNPYYTEDVARLCMEKIFKPTVKAMKAEGRPFKGVLFAGLMLTENGPEVLEYNARFGDPETQAVLPRLETDIIDIMESCIDGRLSDKELKFKDEACVCVVLASGGYPGDYEKGKEVVIKEGFGKNGLYLFHAGTKRQNGRVVTAGGRVFGVSALGSTIKEARKKAYEAVTLVEFDNKYMRKDIAEKAETV